MPIDHSDSEVRGMQLAKALKQCFLKLQERTIASSNIANAEKCRKLALLIKPGMQTTDVSDLFGPVDYVLTDAHGFSHLSFELEYCSVSIYSQDNCIISVECTPKELR
jgi:hypothetical protein